MRHKAFCALTRVHDGPCLDRQAVALISACVERDEARAALFQMQNAAIDLAARNKTLEEALRRISLDSQSSMGSREECGHIARAALAAKEDE